MSDLTVEMILNLVDAASPKLRAFQDALKTTQTSADVTTSSLDALQEGTSKVAPVLEQAAAAAKVLGAGTRTTARALLNINERLVTFMATAQRSVMIINELSSAMGRLSAQSKGLADSLNVAKQSARTTTTAFNGTFRALSRLGASADENSLALGRLRDVLGGVAPEAEAVAGATTAAATAMGAMGAEATGATRKVAGLHDGIKGLIEIYGGLKIAEGVKSSIGAANTFETQLAQLRALGLSGNAIQYARNASWNTAANLPYVNINEALGARRALIAGMGVNDPAVQNAVLPQLLKDAYIYKNLISPTMSMNDIVKNFATLAEARGMSQTPQGIKEAANQALQVAIGSQSRIKLTTQEVVARQTKYGGAQLMNRAGYFNTMAVAEQYMPSGREAGGGAGGRGVSTVGTAVSMVLKTMLGGKMNKVTYHLMEQMGLIGPGAGAGTPGGHTMTTEKNALVHILGSTKGMQDIWGWLTTVGAPHMLAYVKQHPSMYFSKGANVNSPEAQKMALDRLAVQMFGPTGGINVGNMAFMAADPAVAARIQNSRNLMQNAKTGDAGISQLNQYQMSLQKFQAAIQNLKVALGGGLLPILTPIVNAFAAFFRGLGEVAHEAPAAATAISGLGVALSGLLIYKGFVALVGSIRTVMAAFTSMAGTAKVAAATTDESTATAAAGVETSDAAMAATTVATGTTMIATARAIAFGVSRWLLRAIPVVGTAILLADLVGQFKVAGVSIENWAIGLGASIVGAIDHAINWVINKVVSATIAVRNLLASAAKYTGWTSEEARLKSANASDRATLASWNASEGIRQQAFRMMVVHDTTPAGPGKAPAAMPNSAQQAYEAENAAANVLPPMEGSALPGGKGRKGRKSDAAKKAEEEAKKQLAAINRLYTLADRAAAKADAIVAKMNAAAQKIHLAFQAITDPLGAKIAGVNLKYGEMSSEMMKAGHPNAATEALAIGHHKVLQYQYQGAMQQLSQLKGNLHQTLTGIAAQVTAGSLTKMQGSQQSIQAQKDAAPAMVQAANAALVYAKALGDPKLVQALEEQKMKLQAMGQQLGYYSSRVRDTMQSSFTGLLENIMHGQKTWGQMLYSFFASIGKGIENILAKSISQAIADSIMGKKTNQGIGSLIGGIAKWFGGLFGGSGTSATTISATGGRASSGPGMWSMISAGGGFLKDLFSVIGSFAVGADNIPHDMVAQIHKGEMIIPAGPAAAIRSGTLGSSNGAQNHLHLTIHAMDSQSVIGALHSVREEAAQMFINTAQHLNFNGG